MKPSPDELKAQILRLTREYSRVMHAGQRPGSDAARATWEPGQTIPYAGRVFDADEVEAAVGATLDFWLTLGPEGAAFENEFAALLGVKHSLLVNSGSSANLVAFAALTTHKLPPHKRIQPGDEVITVAAGFPTTVTPILQLGAVPVFLDNNPATGNIQVAQLEAAYVAGRTKAVMIAHALGNPFDLSVVLQFCRNHDLWLIEDNCDALGCTYSLPVARAKVLGLDHLLKLAELNSHQSRASAAALDFPKEGSRATGGHDNAQLRVPFVHDGILTAYTGTFGDISTQSFYPPHHLTMGEGGAVNIVSRPSLKTYAESFRDWGRDCWCASGKDDTCGKRFGWQLGELPKGYDHKYIYSHLGYNLKPLDPQAAIGRQQLAKLPDFIEARKRNWEYLRAGLAGLEDVFDFTLPTHATRWIPPSERRTRTQPSMSGFNFEACFEWDESGCRTDASWFGFMLRVKPTARFGHTDLARHLDQKKIGNRMFFGGNLLRQPVFVQLRRDRPNAFRVISADGRTLSSAELEPETRAAVDAASPTPGADEIMHRALFLGTYPGLTTAMLQFEIETIRSFVDSC